MGGVSGKTKEAPEPGLVGIHNFQNTCYMNASLQCLAHTTLLAHHFLLYHRDRRLLDNPPISSTANLASPCPSPAHLVPGQDMTALVAGASSSSSKGRFTKSPSPPLSDDVDKPLCVGELSDEFARVIYTIWNGKTASFKPRKFKELIDRVDTRFKGVKDQHDAFEFLLEVLIAKLHQDLVGVNRMRSISPSHSLSPDIPLDSVDPLLWQVPSAYSHSMLPASVPSIKRSLTNSSSASSLSYHSRSPSLEPPHMPHPGLDGGSSQPGGPPNDADYKSRQKRTARVRLFINRNELHRRDKDWKLTFRQLAVNTWQQRMNEKGRSIFTDHFHGQYKKMVFCSQCDHVAISFPLFLYIDLPLHINEKHPIALADLLARHESSEILEDWKCDWCTKKNGQKVQGRLVLSLWKLPDILMLRLGRVHRRPGQEDDKINHAISFPLHGLNCSPYLCTDSPYAPHHRSATTPQSMRAPFSPLSSSSTDSAVQSPSSLFSPGSGLERLYNETDEDWVSRMSLSYDLYAVLHHQGETPKHGHYVAEVLNHFDGKFYSFNDKKIEQLKSFDSNEYVSQQAYILFYQSRYSVAIHERQVQSWSELLGANSSSPLPLPPSHQQLSALPRSSPPPDALNISPSLPLPLPLPSNPPSRDSLKPKTPSPEICAQVSAMRIDPRPMDPPRADMRPLPSGPPSQSPMSTNQPQRITARSHATLTEVSVLQHLLPFHPNQQQPPSHPLAPNPNPRPLPVNPGSAITGVRPSSAVSPPPVLVQDVGRHGPVTIDERIRKPRPKTPRLCRGC